MDLNMPRASVHLAMQVLLESSVIKRDDKGRLFLNKDYENWQTVQPTGHQEASSPLDESVQPTGHQASSPLDTYKEKDKQLKKERQGTNIPPSIEEVKEYCLKRKNSVDPVRFWHYYEANGWRVGRNKMKNWHSAICGTWEKDAKPKREDKEHTDLKDFYSTIRGQGCKE